MKHLTLILSLSLAFTALYLSPPQVEWEGGENLLVTRRRLPTKEEVLVATFREETPQAKELIMRESGNNPTVINKSSGACGVPQSLPCSKMKCKLSHDIRDYACQLNWMARYTKERYGNFKNALAFHDEHNYY